MRTLLAALALATIVIACSDPEGPERVTAAECFARSTAVRNSDGGWTVQLWEYHTPSAIDRDAFEPFCELGPSCTFFGDGSEASQWTADQALHECEKTVNS